MSNIYEANNQWNNRPVDESFWGIEDAADRALSIRDNSAELGVSNKVTYGDIKVVQSGSTGIVASIHGDIYQFTHSAAQQLCQRVGVPHSYVSQLPAQLAADNLKWGLSQRSEENCVALVYTGEGQWLRAVTSERYNRLWNVNFLTQINQLVKGSDWRVPPARPSSIRSNDPRARAATADDIRGIEGVTSIRVGDTIAPAGCYLSDHDMFLFIVSARSTIEGPSGSLSRFAIFFNNEIGTGSFGMMLGYFDHVCGNHIIWGAQKVVDIRGRHISGRRFSSSIRGISAALEVAQNGTENLLEDEKKIQESRKVTFGIVNSGRVDRESVIDNVSTIARTKRLTALTNKRVGEAYDIANANGRYGAPNTAWAIFSGLTELSQRLPFGDERLSLDRSSAQLLDL